jgi:protein-tyrosine phosphatase
MPRSIDINGTFNFRDFGGYASTGRNEVRSGMLFRSGSIDKVMEPEASRIQGEFSIETIMDLRHPDELQDNDTRGILADLVPNRYMFSIIDPHKTLLENRAELDILYGIGQSGPRYFGLLENSESLWQQIIQILIDPDSYPILAHCTAGKDRTGIIAALILDLAGVDQNTISLDYEMSSATVDQLFDYLVGAGRTPVGDVEVIKSGMLAPRKNMDDFLVLLRQKYGGAEGYIRNLGFSDGDISTIKDFLNRGNQQ